MARLGFVGVLSFVVLGLMLGSERSEGATYTVGDTTGWGVPTSSEFYDNWTEGKTFAVGDVLSFTWNGIHDVVPVNEAQHDACTKVTANVISTSPATITLNNTGSHYFICTINDHCSRGQKLDIEVVAATPTTPTTGTSPPPPSTTTTPGTTTPPPPSTTTTTPPPPNSSGSFGPIVALSALLSVMVFSFLS